MRGRSATRLTLVALLMLGAAPASAALPSLGFELGAGYDSNIGNAGSDEDIRGAATVNVGTSVAWEHRFGLYTALQWRNTLAAEHVFDLEDLSSVRATTRLRLLHKPGEGFYVPVLAAWGSLGARDYGSPIRDSYDYRGGVSLTEPVTTTVQVRAEAMATRRDARGRAFDLDGYSYGLNVDWLVSGRTTAYGGVRVDNGTFAVTAEGHGDITPKTEHLYLENYAEVIQQDRAFGGDWWAFRVDGRTTIVTAGVNLPLSNNLALDAQIQRGDASVRSYSYARWIGGVSLLMRW